MSRLRRTDAPEKGGLAQGTIAGHEPARVTVHGAILQSMTNGVISIDAEGTITTFNAAAARVLRMDRRDVIGRTLAEAFIEHDGFDQLTEAVLAPVYGDAGDTGERRVAVERGGERRVLTLNTAYLRSAGRGVVAVFADITETEALRETERTLGKRLEAQNVEIRNAYRKLEAQHKVLAGVLRKVQIVRTAAIGVLAVVCAGVAAYAVGVPLPWTQDGPAAGNGTAGPARTHTVATGRIEEVVSIPGKIVPLVNIVVRSPLEATVAAAHARPGQEVRSGDLLFELDVSDLAPQRRSAEIAYLEALAREEELASWEQSVDVARAKRALTKARIALETGRSGVEQMRFLYERGLVPRAKLVAAEREQRSRELDLDSVERDLQAVREEGGEQYKVAVFKTANARSERERLERLTRDATVRAPAAGVVLEREGRNATVSAGSVVESGEHLITIARGGSLAVRGRIDEARVHEIAVGDKVRISGAAFPRMAFDGEVVEVSAHATQDAGRGVPGFALAAALDAIGDEARHAIRLGMSATIEIVIYENDQAVLVPIGAVDPRAKTVRRLGGDGTIETVEIETGRTDAGRLEVLSGLRPGDEVIVP